MENKDPQKIRVLVAFSGGVDSVVLLHFLVTQFAGFSIQAVHINHQLLAEANQWETFCKKCCKQLKVRLKIVRVSIKRKPGESLEAIAREKRYAALFKMMQLNDVLLTAHHQDDQAETVLLQLFRGAGLRGVASMPAIAPLEKGFLVRPLLKFSRQQLLSYAKFHELTWIEDPSNVSLAYDRNFLRQSIFPALQQRWPQLNKTLARFAKHCAEQENLLQEYAAQLSTACHGEYLNSLKISALLKLTTPMQNLVLRYFFQQQHCPSPSEKLLKECKSSVLNAKRDANPCIQWNNLSIRRYQDHLIIVRTTPSSRAHASCDASTLSADELRWCTKHLAYSVFHPSLTIKFRQGGEKFIPSGKRHSRLLKKLLQEWQVPPWQRNQIPLIYNNDKLIAVIGYDKGNCNEPFDD